MPNLPVPRRLVAFVLNWRPLPPPALARLQRYYEPLRHPGAPGLSLTGVRLIIPDHASGFPACCVRFPCVHARRHCPGAADGRTSRSTITIRVSLPPIPLSGRPAHRPFERFAQRSPALRPAHSHGHQILDRPSGGFRHFRRLHACSRLFPAERSPGGACTCWKAPPGHGARENGHLRPFRWS